MATPQTETSEDKKGRKAPLKHSSRESRMLSRTQALMVVVSLIPLGVLFYISATFVFEPLMEQGQGAHVYSISAILLFTALTVLLGYVLVRRDTVRAITAIGEGERRLDQLHVATGAIAAHTDPTEARKALLSHAAELVGATRTSFWVLEGSDLVVCDAIGLPLERARQHPIPRGQGLIGTAAAELRALLNVELGQSDLNWDDRVRTSTRDSLVVPLAFQGQLVGVLDMRNKQEGRFDAVDLQLAEGLARQSALFINNAQYREVSSAFETEMQDTMERLMDRYLCWPGHADNVIQMCDKLGRRLALSDDKLAALRTAALLHDIGLLDCPETEDGPTGGHVSHMEKGAAFAERSGAWSEAAPLIRSHHELMDGTGPLEMRGFAIPVPARILALAEYVDNHCNPNSPWCDKTLKEVITELQDEDDKRFDARVVAAFLAEHGVDSAPPPAATPDGEQEADATGEEAGAAAGAISSDTKLDAFAHLIGEAELDVPVPRAGSARGAGDSQDGEAPEEWQLEPEVTDPDGPAEQDVTEVAPAAVTADAEEEEEEDEYEDDDDEYEDDDDDDEEEEEEDEEDDEEDDDDDDEYEDDDDDDEYEDDDDDDDEYEDDDDEEEEEEEEDDDEEDPSKTVEKDDE